MTTAVAIGPRIERQAWVALVAAAALLGGALFLGSASWRHGVLLLIGGALGLSLYHAAFGFTSAYRNAIVHRDVAGVSAQLVMLAVAMLLFAPILADGAGGAVAPVGIRVMVGSFLFGLGMQLGGGCGSGTLYTAGGGSARMVVTLVAFCAGAFLGSLDAGRWAGSWSLGSISLARELGWLPAIALQLAVLAVVWLALRAWARGRPQTPLWGSWTSRLLPRGPWPLLLSAVLLAILNALTLVVAGHPWTITWAFTLWGAEVATAFGWDPATSPFWSGGFPQAALARGVFGDHTSIMNVGILLGALAGAGMAHRFAPTCASRPARCLQPCWAA
jgi:hypothetical protein